VQIVQGEGAAQLFVAPGGRLTCERKTPWRLPAVMGEPDLLSLALCNLLQNACEFTPPTGQVQVVVRDERPGVSIDTGRGILPEDQACVGQELYRGQNVGNLPGRGLGLALARAIVERHKGTLDIRSTAGQGTVATVRLPLNKEKAT
jgi:two-component system OmpR family sensor kinase